MVERDNLVPLNKEGTLVTITLISLQDNVYAPCFIVHRDATEPSFAENLEYFRSVKLEIMKTDMGGYFFSVSSDQYVIEVREDEFTRSLRGGSRAVELVKKAMRESMPKFQASHLTTNYAGEKFLECLSENQGEWVLVVLASDATIIFVKKDIITGNLVVPRDVFLVHAPS